MDSTALCRPKLHCRPLLALHWQIDEHDEASVPGNWTQLLPYPTMILRIVARNWQIVELTSTTSGMLLP
jgi:hypothetical protein